MKNPTTTTEKRAVNMTKSCDARGYGTDKH